ncbi:MAG: penicillin-binding protein [Lachnospiraceae bacterium]|nr:penicillin-binding protein [Lachnospiraceae bacterium]
MALGGILIYRLFDLQIIRGQEYLDDFILQSKKTREISATRGKIFDRNGNVLAYDELAYSVKIEDVYETTGRSKNKQLNANIYKLIKMIEKNGDEIIHDFGIMIDENGQYAFSASSETQRLRFLADIYGHSYISSLKEEQRTATADDVMNYMAGSKKYAVGDYEDPEDTSSDFIPGKGYTKDEVLKIVNVRYAMSLTSFQKYIGTYVAKDVNAKTVAAIMENNDELDGVSIVEDTVRRYEHSIYFSHIIGYTGKITSDEITSFNAADLEQGGDGERYSATDTVGKIGIEASMESTLQGRKGIETVFVNNTGKVMSVLEEESREAVAGNDVYLTIDMDLQIATYNILEQKIAGILVSNIQNIKEVKEGANNDKPPIPIYDVYYALFNNNVIDTNRFTQEYASDVEKEVYQTYLEYKNSVYEKLRNELTDKKTPYKKLKKEYQVYQSNIVTYLMEKGILDSSKIDKTDDVYIAWTKEEKISLNEYLNYAISMGWVDVTKIDLDSKYADSEKIYEHLLNCIFEILDYTSEFQKKLYKYMLLSDKITGKQVCLILCEQGYVEIDETDVELLYRGKISAFNFMINRISSLEITPAQLALDPCTGSVVITDVTNGDVLALVSYPGYDNNKMSDSAYYSKLRVDKAEPQWNHATQQMTAPGSTFKMVTATAILNEGIITTKSKIDCTGIFETVTPSPRCWVYPGRHGNINVTTAIQKSCNYFFYEMGYRLSSVNGSYNAQTGLDTLEKYAAMYGLTEKSGVEIAESTPHISTELPIQSAIGQGTNNFSTVGLAKYVTAVANRGTVYNLTLLDKVTDSLSNVLIEYEPEIYNEIQMPSTYWDSIQLGMRRVVEGKSYFSDLAVNVAGKTGTAQENLSRADHALFVGYAPYEKPEIAIATRIAFGYTSDYAAQTTRDIIKYHYGLAETDDIITGSASELDEAGFNND